jgi:hypothetical protein
VNKKTALAHANVRRKKKEEENITKGNQQRKTEKP